MSAPELPFQAAAEELHAPPQSLVLVEWPILENRASPNHDLMRIMWIAAERGHRVMIVDTDLKPMDAVKIKSTGNPQQDATALAAATEKAHADYAQRLEAYRALNPQKAIAEKLKMYGQLIGGLPECPIVLAQDLPAAMGEEKAFVLFMHDRTPTERFQGIDARYKEHVRADGRFESAFFYRALNFVPAANVLPVKPQPVIVADVNSMFRRKGILNTLAIAQDMGYRVILSHRDTDTAMEEMVRMLTRDLFAHDGKSVTTHAELKQGAEGVMGQDHATIYISDTPDHDGVAFEEAINSHLVDPDAVLRKLLGLPPLPEDTYGSPGMP